MTVSVGDGTARGDALSREDQSTGTPRRRTDRSAVSARRFAEPVGVAVLLIATLVAYLCNLSANGWANSFYSAAIQAGSQSWKAWFFGSSDAANSITVDKPPMSLWIPGIAVRIFGLNSWSILVPQVLMAVASVGLLYWMGRKYFGPAAGFLAGITLALTPVAALMFRFNNPDALLVLLMIGAVAATLKGIEDGRVRWMVLTGVLVGFGFLTKQLQVFLVIPPLAITYLAFGRKTWLIRLGHLVAALAAMIVSAGWWILTVELWPKDSRPYIGGSQHNSILELTFGYNGFGRLSGDETGSVVPGRGTGDAAATGGGYATGFAGAPGGMGGPGGAGRRGGGMWGQTGFFRMFQPEQGGQISWLIPAALILGVLGIVLCGKAARTDLRRAYFAVWGLWLLVTMAVFSYMAGIFHPYYTVALAPAIAALIGGGAWMAWRARERWWVRVVVAATVLITGIWSFVLLGRASDFVPWLRYLILLAATLGALIVMIPGIRSVAMIGAALALFVGLAGPTAYTVDTLATAHEGSIPSAGPRTMGGFGPGGHWRGGRVGPTMFGGTGNGMGPANGTGAGGTQGGGPQGGGPQGGGVPGGPGGGNAQGGMNGMPAPGGSTQGGSTQGGFAGGMTGSEGFGGMGGPGGGLLDGSRPSAEMTSLLEAVPSSYTWVAAATGSNTASGYQLAVERSVMPIGGFNGTDPSPTLAQFQRYVAEHRIYYYIAGGGFGGSSGSGTSAQIRDWVESTFTARTVGTVTVYDLTQPKG